MNDNSFFQSFFFSIEIFFIKLFNFQIAFYIKNTDYIFFLSYIYI